MTLVRGAVWVGAFILLPVVYIIVFGRKDSANRLIRMSRIWTESNLATIGYIVPFGYTAILAFFLWIFDSRCGTELSYVHLVFCRVLYTLPFTAMALCVFSDPGTITRSNHAEALKHFKFDRILYMPHNECSTCQFEKPARSKHCSICNNCIEMQDHHCIWVNNCIGRSNFKFFIYFLLAHIIIFGYGLVVLVPLVSPGFHGSSIKQRVWGAIERNETACCLIVLCFLIGWITVIFSFYTLYFVYLGITTNEQDKWDDVHDLIKDGVLYTFEQDRSIVLQKYENTNKWNRALTPEERLKVGSHPLIKVKSFEDLDNIYDDGFWRNVWALLTA